MAKKKSDKETEPKKVSTKRFSAFLKNETTHFVIGLISVIFAVYLLLAFTSFFFTGAADQSILDNQQPGELMQTANHVKNYAGARGAQLAEFLINECFGLAAYFIILFLAVVGMKLMKAYQFRIWKWFMSCSILLIWFSITLGFIFDGTFGDSFIYPGGLHGHNVSNWLISQIGIPGLGLLLFIAALLFFIYLSNETILVIRKALRPSFRRKKKEDQTISATEENPIKEAPRKEESRKEFSNPGPAIVDFELEQPTKKEEEVEEQVPFPFESKQVTEPAVIEEPAYTNEEEEVENTDEPDFSISEETNEEDEAYKGPVLPPYNPRLDLENYKFPSLDLLNEYEDDGPNIDMEEQNANKDSKVIPTQRDLLAGIVAKHYARQHLLPRDVVQAHERGDIHYHDLDYSPFFPMFNCMLIDLKGMLTQGFKMGNAEIEPPKSISTATAVTAQIIAQVASHIYGGTTINRIDEVLAPFVTASYNKHRKTAEEWNIPDAEGYANSRTIKECYDAFQSLEYEVNTLHTANGQTPFVTFGFGLGTSWESRLIQESILRNRIAGLGKNRKTAVFPKLVFAIRDGLNHKKGDPNYDIKQLALECASKRIRIS